MNRRTFIGGALAAVAGGLGVPVRRREAALAQRARYERFVEIARLHWEKTKPLRDARDQAMREYAGQTWGSTATEVAMMRQAEEYRSRTRLASASIAG